MLNYNEIQNPKKRKAALGFRARGRKIICDVDTFELREVITSYGQANDLNPGNTYLWDQQPATLF